MCDKDTDTDTLHRRWGGNEAVQECPDPSSCHPDIDQEQQSPWPGDIYSSVPGCVCKLTISSGPSETNSRSREIRNRTLMNWRLNNWLGNILVTPGLMPRLVKMLKYPVFWYFTNIPPAARINLTSAHQRGWGWDWESDFHQIKAWHSSYSRPG